MDVTHCDYHPKRESGLSETLKVGVKVLYKYDDEAFEGQWIEATVKKVREENIYDLIDAKGTNQIKIERNLIYLYHTIYLSLHSIRI